MMRLSIQVTYQPTGGSPRTITLDGEDATVAKLREAASIPDEVQLASQGQNLSNEASLSSGAYVAGSPRAPKGG